MLLSNLVFLLAVVFVGLVIGTGIKLYRIGCKRVMIFSFIVPILTLISSISWSIGKLDDSEKKISIKVIIQRMFFCFRNHATLIVISCYAVLDTEREIIKKNQTNLQSSHVIKRYTKTYEKEIDDLYSKSCLA